MSIGAIGGTPPQPPSFSSISSNGSVITRTDLENDVQKHGGTKAQADQLYGRIAGDGSSGITQSQWNGFTSQLQSSGPGGEGQRNPPPNLDDLFKTYGDSNGKLTKSGLEKAFKDHGKSAAQADQLWSKVAGTASSITEDQFKSALQSAFSNANGLTGGSSGSLVNFTA